MSRQSTIWIAAMFVVLLTVNAHAQAKWDVAAVGGLFAAHAPEPEVRVYQQDWYHSALGGVIIGRHFTPHLKLELEATATSEGTQFVQRYIPIANHPDFLVGAEARQTVRSFATVMTWQFFDNQWIHPFVQAGIAADVNRRVVHTWQQNVYTADPSRGGVVIRVPETIDGPHTTTAASAVVGAGAKMYVSPRLFIRAEGRTAFGQRRQHVALRVGAGVDF